MGYWVSKFLVQDGGKICTIIERDAAIYNPDGFDVDDVKKHMAETNGDLSSYPHATETETQNPLSFMEREVDFIIPAAVEKSINIGNAKKLQCKAIFEGANGPTTFAAEEILIDRGIMVVPDMLANGGGVTCSYFEWLKNLAHVSHGKMTRKFEQESTMTLLQHIGYSREDVNLEGGDEKDIVYTALDEIMSTATAENWEYALDKNLSFRDACLVRAMSKIHQHYKDVGFIV